MIKKSLTSFVSKKLILVTNGCGWTGNAVMSNDTFAEKSAFALAGKC